MRIDSKKFSKLLVGGSLLCLGLIVAASYLPAPPADSDEQFDPIINHSEIKDTTNYEYQDSIEQAAKAKEYEADSIHLR